jgi:hypothetical protein
VVGLPNPDDDRQPEILASGPAQPIETSSATTSSATAEEQPDRGVVGAGPDPAHRSAQTVGEPQSRVLRRYAHVRIEGSIRIDEDRQL